jgi:hypothetical protein
MPSTDRKLELKAKTSMAQTTSQAAVYAKGLTPPITWNFMHQPLDLSTEPQKKGMFAVL